MFHFKSTTLHKQQCISRISQVFYEFLKFSRAAILHHTFGGTASAFIYFLYLSKLHFDLFFRFLRSSLAWCSFFSFSSLYQSKLNKFSPPFFQIHCVHGFCGKINVLLLLHNEKNISAHLRCNPFIFVLMMMFGFITVRVSI